MNKPRTGYHVIAKSSDEVEAYLYGNVGEWGPVNSRQFSNEYRALQSKYKRIKVRINSKGGDVFEGNSIHNLILSSNVDTHTINDGVAASIGAIIFMAGHKRYMASNALLMLHAASGMVYGQAQKLREAALLLDKINAGLIETIVKQTGKKEEEVKKWFAEDKDTWFTAQEALDAGLIHGIVAPVNKKIDSPKNLQGEALEQWMTTMLNSAELPDNEDTQKQKNKMKILAQLIALYGLTNITNAEDETAVFNAVKAHKEAQDQEIQGLKAKVTSHQTDQVTALVDAAVKDGRITAAQKPQYEALAKTDFENTKAVLESLKPVANLSTGLKPAPKGEGAGVIPEARKDWDWNEWSKKDPDGLMKLKNEHEEEYQALYDKTFKK